MAHTIFETIKTDIENTKEGEERTEELLYTIVAEVEKIFKNKNFKIDVRSHLT